MTTEDKTLHLVVQADNQDVESVKINWDEFSSVLLTIDEKIGLIVEAYYDYVSDDEDLGIESDQMALGQDLGRSFKSLLIEQKRIIPEVFNWIEHQLNHLDFAYILNSEDDMVLASHRLMLQIQYELLIGAYNGKEEQTEESPET